MSIRDSCLKCCQKDSTEDGIKVLNKSIVFCKTFSQINPLFVSNRSTLPRDWRSADEKWDTFLKSMVRLKTNVLIVFLLMFLLTKAFIRGDKSRKFPNLSVKYVRGAEPVIKLLDSNGEEKDELNIQKWDTDTIDEFLSQHLL